MVLPSLRRRKDINHFFASATRFRFPDLTLLIAPSRDGVTRCLIVAGRKVGKAVQRNRARRRVRALLTAAAPGLRGSWWIGVVCTRQLLMTQWADLLSRVEGALTQAGALALGRPEPSE